MVQPAQSGSIPKVYGGPVRGPVAGSQDKKKQKKMTISAKLEEMFVDVGEADEVVIYVFCWPPVCCTSNTMLSQCRAYRTLALQ